MAKQNIIKQLSSLHKSPLTLVDQWWEDLFDSVAEQFGNHFINYIATWNWSKFWGIRGIWNLWYHHYIGGINALRSWPLAKNSLIASVTSCPIVLQHVLKKPLVYPSGLRDFSLEIEKMFSLISLLVISLHNNSCYSVLKIDPWSIMICPNGILTSCCLPRSSW